MGGIGCSVLGTEEAFATMQLLGQIFRMFKCSVRCTIGQLDENAMFYLRTRGIPTKEAKALLMYAFANNVLESVKILQLKKRINKLVANELVVYIGFDL